MMDFILKIAVYLWGFFLIAVGISFIVGFFCVIISCLTGKKLPWMKDDTFTINGKFTINEKKKK